MQRNASRTNLIQWVLFKPYDVNRQRVEVFSSNFQGIRFEPPEGSILWSEWDESPDLPGNLVDKVVIGKGVVPSDPMVFVLLNKRLLQVMRNSWEGQSGPEPGETILFGLLVGEYLVNFTEFTMENLSDCYLSLQLPFFLSLPAYSVEQLKKLFPDAVDMRKEK